MSSVIRSPKRGQSTAKKRRFVLLQKARAAKSLRKESAVEPGTSTTPSTGAVPALPEVSSVP